MSELHNNYLIIWFKKKKRERNYIHALKIDFSANSNLEMLDKLKLHIYVNCQFVNF